MVHPFRTLFGGCERLAHDLGHGLMARGHAVRVFTSDVGVVPASGPFEARPLAAGPTEVAGLAVERLPYLAALVRRRAWARGPIPGRSYLRRWFRAQARRTFTRAAIQAVRRWGPDALISMRAWDLPALAAADVRDALGVPLVYSPQMHADTPGWRPAAVRALVARADALAANSAHERDRLTAGYGARPERVVVTGCGAHPAPAPGPWPRPAGVLYFGRKTAQKGVPLLLEAMARVWDARPDARLVLAGARDPVEAPRLAADRARLPAHLAARIEDLDDVGEARRQELMAGAACLCLPSEHESFGIVLLEAWAHATPVVALDLPLMRELVGDGEAGLLARPGDPAHLAGRILRLLDDPALARRLGAAGAARLAARHRPAQVAARYEEAVEVARAAAHARRGRGAPAGVG